MTALVELHRMGIEAKLSPEGKIRLAGLNRLGKAEAARALALARERKGSVLEALQAFETIRHSFAQGLLRVVQTPGGLAPDLDEVAARFGNDGSVDTVTEWWGMAAQLIRTHETELLNIKPPRQGHGTKR